jgi:hypothetical protein
MPRIRPNTDFAAAGPAGILRVSGVSNATAGSTKGGTTGWVRAGAGSSKRRANCWSRASCDGAGAPFDRAAFMDDRISNGFALVFSHSRNPGNSTKRSVTTYGAPSCSPRSITRLRSSSESRSSLASSAACCGEFESTKMWTWTGRRVAISRPWKVLTPSSRCRASSSNRSYKATLSYSGRNGIDPHLVHPAWEV